MATVRTDRSPNARILSSIHLRISGALERCQRGTSGPPLHRVAHFPEAIESQRVLGQGSRRPGALYAKPVCPYRFGRPRMHVLIVDDGAVPRRIAPPDRLVVSRSLEEAAERACRSLRHPPAKWRSIRTFRAIGRPRDKHDRRIKTQCVSPCADAACVMTWRCC